MPSYKYFGQETKIFCPKITLGYMGGGRWAWPIFMKLLIFLNFVIKMLYAKYYQNTSTPSIFCKEMYEAIPLCDMIVEKIRY